MRFTPTTFFSSGEQESCITVRGNGAVSESFSVNGVNWDVLIYSCSQQEGGSGTEAFEFHVDSGSTKHGIVVVGGGGGAGASSGEGGGGGGVQVATELVLTETVGVPYQVIVGEGGNGTDRSVVGLPFSGDDGSQTRFSGGGINLIASGGEGGNLNGNGGTSGNGETSTGDAGAGAATGSSDDFGGTGFTIYKNFTEGVDDIVIRAGGGGRAETVTGTDTKHAEDFGGGEQAFPSPGTEINGKGGSRTATGGAGSIAFSGGGTGGQYFRSGDSRYISSAGGGGFVMVAVPTNLCTQSLYDRGNIVLTDLIGNYDASNPISFGKDLYSSTYKSTQRGNISLQNTYPGPITYDDLITTNYTSSNPIISYNDATYVYKEIDGISTGVADVIYELSGSLSLDVSAGFSMEWTGKMPTAASSNSSRVMALQSTSTTAYVNINRERTGLGGDVKFIYNSGTTLYESADISLDTNTHHHVVTYDGTTFKYYIDTVLQDSFAQPITSSLDNPNLVLFDSAVNEYYFSSSRVYSTDLDTSQIEQNYSASLGL
jgi:hypothetical protein